ncbi:MAG: FAD-dependent thymidylate synthase [Planctomycetaceae bacterium]|jgi:thymidylate synthase (FAD)|nr:FAD-dependent thymidylate synthase [Planctomycetaceae bacterium]
MKNTDQISALRWKKIPVLDNGFVCLVDVMGDDSAIVQAARVSYGEGTKKPSDDRTLLRYLLRHQHTTPFEMAELKLLVRVPMDCWRQWIRHRTASVNEYSTRYSIAIDATYNTNPAEWRTQNQDNRQGSCGFLEEEIGKTLTEEEREFHTKARNLYDNRIAGGVAREQARKDLPLSTYTEAYWKVDLHNLLRFLYLRMDSSAQFEISQYATAIGEQIVQPLFPYCWEAFLDYQRCAIRLSRLEQEVIARLAQTGNIPATREQFLTQQDQSWQSLDRCREREECYEKLKKLRIVQTEIS